MPLLIAGGQGGTLETGRALDYNDHPDEDRKLCGWYLSLMQRMGLSESSFGDAEKPLQGV